MKELFNYFLNEANYFVIYGLSFLYFCVLYFALAPLFLSICRRLEKHKILELVVINRLPKNQIKSEIKHSLVSIIIFGFSGVVMLFMYREKWVDFIEPTVSNTLLGALILTLWNELHFFVVHRIMHIPFLYRTVHKIHHQSKISTVYSVYSFHWLEATLLSTVPMTIAPFFNFSASAIFLYPLASILLNYAGHCNYRFGKGEGVFWKLISTRHAFHHFKNSKNFGFALTTFDWLFTSNKKTKH